MTSTVPSIDLSPFVAGSQDGKREVAREVARACEDIGFFKIRRHGVPPALIERAFATAGAFFASPQDVKDRFRPATSASARGYHALTHEESRQDAGLRQPAGSA